MNSNDQNSTHNKTNITNHTNNAINTQTVLKLDLLLYNTINYKHC